MNGNAPAAGALVQMLPFLVILVLFYFLLMRPQQQKARETQEMLDGLKPGDNIVTAGGIHGKIVKLQEDEVTVEIAPNLKIRVERSSIGRVVVAGKNGGEKKK